MTSALPDNGRVVDVVDEVVVDDVVVGAWVDVVVDSVVVVVFASEM